MHRDNKLTRWLVHSPLLFTCQNLQTKTGHQCLPRNRHLLEMSYFTPKYGVTSLTCCDEPTPGCTDIWPWHRNRRDSISVTMFWVPSKFFRKIWQNSKHDFHPEGNWPIGVHFRWPCLSGFLCMLGGRFMPSLSVPVGFGRANYSVTQHATGQWQTVSSGVHVCVSSSKQKESHFGRLVEIVDSAPFDATQGLLPCYNRERPRGYTLPPQTDSRGLIDNTSFWWQGLIP